MKILLSSRGLFAIGFVILVATNVVVLSGVASNRSGTPDAQLVLTERELQLPYREHKENSGFSFSLVWRQSYTYTWLNTEKLEELGFNIVKYLSSKDNVTFYVHPLPKEVFIVLENNGESYREAVKIAEIALEKWEKLFKLNSGDELLRDTFEMNQQRLKRELTTESRLFAIDAGLDSKKLSEKYTDRTRFIITSGVVEISSLYNKKREDVYGYISHLSVESIHVPLKHKQVFDNFLAAQDRPNKTPSYEVELAYGSRLEPWIMSVKYMGGSE